VTAGVDIQTAHANDSDQPEAAASWVSSGAIAVNRTFPWIAFNVTEVDGG